MTVTTSQEEKTGVEDVQRVFPPDSYAATVTGRRPSLPTSHTNISLRMSSAVSLKQVSSTSDSKFNIVLNGVEECRKGT